MNFDPFAALARIPSGAMITIHNVQLIDVHQSDDGYEQLVVEHAGITHKLISGRPWNEACRRHDLGLFGYIVPAVPFSQTLPAGSCYFRAYVDQSLRRVPELDSHDQADSHDSRVSEVIGWRCDTRPGGFRTPIGIIPGEAGCFLPDETIPVTVHVPPEFIRECRRVQLSPEDLLRSFIGDLAGIQNFVACPRADGYGSNGSDERDHAMAWLDRAHGFHAIDLEALEQREFEAGEKALQREDFVELLDDFEHFGGKADELFTVVQALVDRQRQVGEKQADDIEAGKSE